MHGRFAWFALLAVLVLVGCGVPDTGSSATSGAQARSTAASAALLSANAPLLPPAMCANMLSPVRDVATPSIEVTAEVQTPSTGGNDHLLVLYKACKVSYAQLNARQVTHCHDYAGPAQLTCFDTGEEVLLDLRQRSMSLAAISPNARTAQAAAGPTSTPNGPPPPDPDWVLPSGQVDPAKLPACFQMVNRYGDTVKDAGGQPVCLPSAELFAPPPPPNGEPAEQ